MDAKNYEGFVIVPFSTPIQQGLKTIYLLLKELSQFLFLFQIISIFFVHFSGPQEVKTFVDLVTNAAGESDFEHDRILDFEAVCQAFRPIIFNVRPDADFDDLYKACNETSIQATPDLFNKLVSQFNGNSRLS